MMVSVIGLILWIGFSTLCGILARQRGRSVAGWVILSLLISPLLCLIALLILKDLSKPETEVTDGKKCPKCAETVKQEAVVCRFCGHQFQSRTSGPSDNAVKAALSRKSGELYRGGTISEPGTNVICNSCNNVADASLKVCPHCESPLYYRAVVSG